MTLQNFDFNLSDTPERTVTPMPANKVPSFNFGEYPIKVTRLESTYAVEAQDQPIADECGINAEFDALRYSIMQRRAESFGYTLTVLEDDAQPQG